MSRLTLISRVVLLGSTVVLATAGCSKNSPQTSTTSSASAGTSPNFDLCMQAMQRSRQCTDVFIPELVDLRIRLDMPKGIAADAAAQGRDQLVEQAHQEWKTDSLDENLAKSCERLSGHEPPDAVAKMNDCLSKTSCEEFVACEIPLMEAHMTAAN